MNPRGNPENLKGKEHKLTKEEMRRGGRSKSILKSIVKRRKCNKDCPLFDRCPFATVGLKYNTCYLNCNDYPTLRKNIIKLLEGDQNDFYDLVSTVIADMLRIIETEDDFNINSKKKVIEALEKLHNMKYGAKSKLEHTGKVDIELFKKWLEEKQ